MQIGVSQAHDVKTDDNTDHQEPFTAYGIICRSGLWWPVLLAPCNEFEAQEAPTILVHGG